MVERTLPTETFCSSNVRRIREERRDVTKTTSSCRCRSNGWAPLAYPASAALSRSSVPNPHFPLHRDVLLAAARELLVLDGTLDGNTLDLNAESSTTSIAADIQETRDPTAHNIASVGEADILMRSNEAFEKRKLPHTSSNITTSKKRKLHVKSLVPVEELPHVEEGNARQNHASAEDLADAIVNNSLLDSGSLVVGPNHFHVESDKPSKRPPRKVSDAEANVVASHLLSSSEEEETPELSLFLNLSERTVGGSYPLLRLHLPPLLVVSIVSESKLRDSAVQMTAKLTSGFDDLALRRFLGYKSSIMKRDRLLRVLSEFLFDVSHAMFAWEQTESEIMSERASDAHSSMSRLDAAVRDALFDKRALNKIGGFDQSSLLPHAVSIGRLRKRNVCWKEFAKSAPGRKMLRHHRNGTTFEVGAKRRGQRLRPRIAKKSTLGEEGKRSRSSSFASTDGIGSEWESKTADSMEDIVSVPPNDTAILFDGMPDIMRLSLRREIGKSWGVLLSKEGDHCVVVRAPIGADNSNVFAVAT